MLKEVRSIKDPKEQHRIRMMLLRGYIKKLASPRGYVAYDTDELRQYKKTVRRGRPPVFITEPTTETLDEIIEKKSNKGEQL